MINEYTKSFNGCHNDSRFSMLNIFAQADYSDEYATRRLQRISDLWSI